jgi:hypothetical protein
LKITTPTLASKALSAGNKLAPIFGVYQGWMSAPQGDVSGKINWIVERLKGFKIADPLITTQIALSMPESYPIAKGAGLFVTGQIIKMVGEAVGINPVERMGSIASKAGMSTAVNALVASYIYEAVNNPHGAGAGGSVAAANYNGGDRMGARPTGESAAIGLLPRDYGGLYSDDPTRLN